MHTSPSPGGRIAQMHRRAQGILGVAHVAHGAALLGIDRQAAGGRHGRDGLGEHAHQPRVRLSDCGGRDHRRPHHIVGKQHRTDEVLRLRRPTGPGAAVPRRAARPAPRRRWAAPGRPGGKRPPAGALVLVGLEGPVDGVEQPEAEHRHIADAGRRGHAVLAQAGKASTGSLPVTIQYITPASA
jgi:hypothetical protein